ncbi:MAG: ABC transporter, partial [Clostridia bacterium]|nr:ABC transporter [Clostridia bacterium]
RQRVGIAQALIGNPSVIIFDEPTVGLDPKQIIEIRNLIRTLGKNHTVILSTHILQEVQAVCDRIIIINKGKLVADELTGNITHAVQTNRRFTAKICGPAREVFAELKSMQGVVGVEQLAERDGDATAFMIESAVGVDIRKTLFYTLSSKSWPLIGLEAQGMNLEDVFISIVDTTGSAQKQPINKRRSTRRESAEDTVAKSIVARTASQKADASKENKEVK